MIDLPIPTTGDQPDPSQTALVSEAAQAVLDQLDAPGNNFPIEDEVPVEALRAVCQAFVDGTAIWLDDTLTDAFIAHSALMRIVDRLQTAHAEAGPDASVPSALTAATTLTTKIDRLVTAAYHVIRSLPKPRRAAAEEAVALAEDVGVPGTGAAAEEAREEVEPSVDAMQSSLEKVNNLTINLFSNWTFDVRIDVKDIVVQIKELTQKLFTLNIAFKDVVIFKGVINATIEGLQKAVAALEAARDAVVKAAKGVAEAASAVKTLIEPIAAVVENGTALKKRVMAAVKRLFGPKEELPWPTGLRLLPPEGRPDEPREVVLHEVRRFDAGEGTIFGLAPLPGGRFVSGGADNTLRLWSVGETTPLAELTEHTDEIKRIATLDGTRVVTASGDQTLILWDLEKRAVLQRFEGHEGLVLDVCALGPDRLVSVAADGDCRVWRVGRTEAERVFNFKEPRGVAALSASRFVTGEYRKNRLCLLGPDRDEPVAVFEQDGSDVWKAAALTPDRFLTVGAVSPELRLWGADRGPLATLTGDHTCQDLAALSSTRTVSAHEDGLILWALPEGERLGKAETPGLEGVRALPPEPGGPPRFVAGGSRGYLALWEVRPKSG